MEEEAVIDAPPATTGTAVPGSGNLLATPPPADPAVTTPSTPATTPPGLEPSGNVLAGLMDDNLSFKEGWRQVLATKIGEGPLATELLESKVLDKYKDLPNALKGLIEVNAMVGADKIAKPGKDASQSVWDQFHKAGGKPDTPEGYKIEFGEGLVPSADRLKLVQEVAHKANLSNSQLQAMVAFQEQDNINLQKAQAQAETDETLATTNALHKEWGGAFDIKLKKVSTFFNNRGLGEIVEKLGLGRNFEFITAFESQVIDTLSEDSSLLGADEPLTPADIDKQIHNALYDKDSPYNRKVAGADAALQELYKARSRNRGNTRPVGPPRMVSDFK